MGCCAICAEDNASSASGNKGHLYLVSTVAEIGGQCETRMEIADQWNIRLICTICERTCSLIPGPLFPGVASGITTQWIIQCKRSGIGRVRVAECWRLRRSHSGCLWAYGSGGSCGGVHRCRLSCGGSVLCRCGWGRCSHEVKRYSSTSCNQDEHKQGHNKPFATDKPLTMVADLLFWCHRGWSTAYGLAGTRMG